MLEVHTQQYTNPMETYVVWTAANLWGYCDGLYIYYKADNTERQAVNVSLAATTLKTPTESYWGCVVTGKTLGTERQRV